MHLAPCYHLTCGRLHDNMFGKKLCAKFTVVYGVKLIKMEESHTSCGRYGDYSFGL